MPTKTNKRKRRIYTPEFKAEVINLIETSGKSIAQVARELVTVQPPKKRDVTNHTAQRSTRPCRS